MKKLNNQECVFLPQQFSIYFFVLYFIDDLFPNSLTELQKSVRKVFSKRFHTAEDIGFSNSLYYKKLSMRQTHNLQTKRHLLCRCVRLFSDKFTMELLMRGWGWFFPYSLFGGKNAINTFQFTQGTIPGVPYC
jgi:hypothetical protein